MDTDAPPARASARPDRRVLVESTSLVLVVALAFAAFLFAGWLVREVIVWLVAAGFLAFSIEPLVRGSSAEGWAEDCQWRWRSCPSQPSSSSSPSRSSHRSQTAPASSRARSQSTRSS